MKSVQSPAQPLPNPAEPLASVAERGCDCCGSQRRTKLFSGPDRMLGRPGDFTFVRCDDCGLLYQWPPLSWEQLAPYYPQEYPSYSRLNQDYPPGLRRWIRGLGPLKQRRHVERFVRGGRLLDVGCATGIFLEELQRGGNWELSGVEPAQESASYLKRRLGVEVIARPFEEVSLPPESQDVVTMWNVFEHLPSPTAALRKAREVLRPGGYLVIAIPNPESLARRLFGRFWVGWELPRHLYAFPCPVFERMLREHGFEPVDRCCFVSSYHVLGHSVSFWTQSWPAALQPLARLVVRAYYTPLTRVLLYPLQLLVERLGRATVITWTARKGSEPPQYSATRGTATHDDLDCRPGLE